MNKVAIVTGASKGLGAAITQRLAQGGITVIASARSEEKLHSLAQTNPEYILPYPCDVTQSAQVQSLVQYAIDTCGKIDLLINNAGLGRFAPLDELTEEDWNEMVQVNLTGVFLACKFAIPYLKKSKGHIINISSVAGTVAFPNGGGYCATKFGLMGLSEALTVELKPHHVKVSTLCPGSIKTEFHPTPDWALEAEQVAETVWMITSAPQNVIFNQIIMRPQVPRKR